MPVRTLIRLVRSPELGLSGETLRPIASGGTNREFGGLMNLDPVAASKERALRYAGRCRACGAALAAGTRAVYFRTSKSIECLSCFRALIPGRIRSRTNERSDSAIPWWRRGEPERLPRLRCFSCGCRIGGRVCSARVRASKVQARGTCPASSSSYRGFAPRDDR